MLEEAPRIVAEEQDVPQVEKNAQLTRWWFHMFFIFTPKIGEDSNLLQQ